MWYDFCPISVIARNTRYEKKSNMELGLLGGMIRGKSIYPKPTSSIDKSCLVSRGNKWKFVTRMISFSLYWCSQTVSNTMCYLTKENDDQAIMAGKTSGRLDVRFQRRIRLEWTRIAGFPARLKAGRKQRLSIPDSARPETSPKRVRSRRRYQRVAIATLPLG